MVRLGEWPGRRGAQVRSSVIKLLCKHGAKPGQIARLPKIEEAAIVAPKEFARSAKKLTPAGGKPAEAVSPEPVLTQTEKDDEMLLQNEALCPQAREHFGLLRSPFVDDVRSSADVYQTGSVRYARAALLDAGLNHSFVALVGESGAGKSTLAEDLEERVAADGRPLLVIRPYVLAMEANDNAGKTLKSSQIAEAIAHALDPRLKIKSSAQARFTQVHELLKASRKAGMRHLLLIEEAHCLPTATLKHLKRFLELKDGMQRLLGIALIAQPELLRTLSSSNAEVREVMQRCERVTLSPLDGDLEGYLRHKLRESEVKLDAIFAPDAMDAIRARLSIVGRDGKGIAAKNATSVCYPLVVNNLVCRAMNACAKAGWGVVDAKVISAC
jgi:type II secretory pathway predicted ATPase ExeA